MEIAVLLAVKNGETFLAEAIQSVLDQSYGKFVLYISNDASTDETLSIIDSFTDHRIRVFTQKKALGQFNNFNFLLQESKEKLVHFWSHDDCMHPHCLKETVGFHTRFANAGMSYCGSDTIDNHGKNIVKWAYDHTPEILSRKQYARYSLAYGCLAGSISQVTLNRATIGHNFFFNGLLKHSGDFDLWTRIAEKSDIGFIRQPLMCIRVHTRQITQQYLSNYFSVVEGFPIVNHIIKWTGLQEKNQKNIFRILYYPLYTNRLLFLLRHSYFKYAWRCLIFLLKNDNIFVIIYVWLKYRLGQKQYWEMEKKKTLQNIFTG